MEKRNENIVFDILKAIAILGMPVVHLMEEGVRNELLTEGAMAMRGPILILPVIGPSIFMLIFGIGMGGMAGWKPMRSNGIRLLILGILLNVCRDVIPGLVGFCHHGEPEWLKYHVIYWCCSDIYVFAGLFLILLSILKKLKLSDFKILVTSIVMLTVNLLLAGRFSTGNEWIDLPLGNFVYVNEDSVFPLLGWFIIPFIGYLFGGYYKKCQDRSLLMKRVTVISAVLYGSICVSLYTLGIDPISVQASQETGLPAEILNVILLTSLAGIITGLLYMLYEHIRPGIISRGLVKLSGSIMAFYVLHWLMMQWFFLIFEIRDMSYCIDMVQFWIICAGLTIIPLVISLLWGLPISKFLLRIASPDRYFKKRKVKTVKGENKNA